MKENNTYKWVNGRNYFGRFLKKEDGRLVLSFGDYTNRLSADTKLNFVEIPESEFLAAESTYMKDKAAAMARYGTH